MDSEDEDVAHFNITFAVNTTEIIRDLANCWFCYYLSNRKQCITINVFNPETEETVCFYIQLMGNVWCIVHQNIIRHIPFDIQSA